MNVLKWHSLWIPGCIYAANVRIHLCSLYAGGYIGTVMSTATLSNGVSITGIIIIIIVMYTVLSSLAACGRLGVAAAAAGVFVCHA